MTTPAILVSWPSAPLTKRLVLGALKKLDQRLDVIDTLGDKQYGRLIQWSSYDEIDHELTNLRRDSVLASSYTFRKALIRKHFLARSIHSYITKNPSSVLKVASPRTYDLDLAFADELDEKWVDDLYELSDYLDQSQDKWWILKPFVVFADHSYRLACVTTPTVVWLIEAWGSGSLTIRRGSNKYSKSLMCQTQRVKEVGLKTLV